MFSFGIQRVKMLLGFRLLVFHVSLPIVKFWSCNGDTRTSKHFYLSSSFLWQGDRLRRFINLKWCMDVYHIHYLIIWSNSFGLKNMKSLFPYDSNIFLTKFRVKLTFVTTNKKISISCSFISMWISKTCFGTLGGPMSYVW